MNLPPSHPGLGPSSTTAIVAASMIGSAVYASSGYLLDDLRGPGWVLLAWLVGGIVAFCGATVYAALATQFTESGGEYMLLARAAHPVAGLMAGWVSLLAGFTGAIALAAETCETYSLPLLPAPINELPPRCIAIALVVVCTSLNLVQTNLADGVQRLIVIAKLALILAFVGYSCTQFPTAWAGYNQATSAPWPGALKFATSLMWISLSYCGFNAAIYMAGEVREPARNVPIGLLAGTSIVIVVYLLLNSIFVLVPTFDQIAGKPDIAAIAAQSLGGNTLVTWVRIIIVLSLCSSVSAMTMAGPRVYAKMAQDGFLPSCLTDQGRPTSFTIMLQGVLAVIVISISTINWLISYLGFTLTVTAAFTSCLIFLPGQRDAARRIPCYPLTPLIFIIATAVTATLAAIREPKQAITAAATILIGALIHLAQQSQKRNTPQPPTQKHP